MSPRAAAAGCTKPPKPCTKPRYETGKIGVAAGKGQRKAINASPKVTCRRGKPVFQNLPRKYASRGTKDPASTTCPPRAPYNPGPAAPRLSSCSVDSLQEYVYV